MLETSWSTSWKFPNFGICIFSNKLSIACSIWIKKLQFLIKRKNENHHHKNQNKKMLLKDKKTLYARPSLVYSRYLWERTELRILVSRKLPLRRVYRPELISFSRPVHVNYIVRSLNIELYKYERYQDIKWTDIFLDTRSNPPDLISTWFLSSFDILKLNVFVI